MANETITADKSKQSSVTLHETILIRQVFEKLIALEEQLARIEEKLGKQLIG